MTTQALPSIRRIRVDPQEAPTTAATTAAVRITWPAYNRQGYTLNSYTVRWRFLTYGTITAPTAWMGPQIIAGTPPPPTATLSVATDTKGRLIEVNVQANVTKQETGATAEDTPESITSRETVIPNRIQVYVRPSSIPSENAGLSPARGLRTTPQRWGGSVVDSGFYWPIYTITAGNALRGYYLSRKYDAKLTDPTAPADPEFGNYLYLQPTDLYAAVSLTRGRDVTVRLQAVISSTDDVPHRTVDSSESRLRVVINPTRGRREYSLSPHNIRVKAETYGSLRISWDNPPPSNDGVRLLGYQIATRPQGTGSFPRLFFYQQYDLLSGSPDRITAALDRLTPGLTYDVRFVILGEKPGDQPGDPATIIENIYWTYGHPLPPLPTLRTTDRYVDLSGPENLIIRSEYWNQMIKNLRVLGRNAGSISELESGEVLTSDGYQLVGLPMPNGSILFGGAAGVQVEPGMPGDQLFIVQGVPALTPYDIKKRQIVRALIYGDW